MSERNGGLSPDQLRAVGVLAGADPADVAGCDPEAVAGWLDREPEFIAGLNRAKSYRRERLRAEIRSLTSEAVKTLRKLVRGADVPPAVRLRACLAILDAADAMEPETIRPTPGRGDKASIDRRVLQTGALQGIIRISMRAQTCAGTAFAVSYDYAGPDWLRGGR
ncbi:MAG: hypothetical protein ACLQU5_17285 [Isosphaeraceae bacterium]